MVEKNSPERVHLNSQEYVYCWSQDWQMWPVYGGIVRALGKGWKVGIVTENKTVIGDMATLSSFLNEENRVEVIRPEEMWSQRNCDVWVGVGLKSNSVRQMRLNLPQSHRLLICEQMVDDDSDLVSKIEIDHVNKSGVLAITGRGKGKTSSGLGRAMESVLAGKKTAVVQWFKEFKDGAYTWAINEHRFPQKLIDASLMQFFPTGLGFFGSPNLDRVRGDEAYSLHRAKAYAGLALAEELILSGEYGEVVLDELVDTVKEIAQNIECPLIELSDMRHFLSFCTRQQVTSVTVTGRRVTDDWAEYVKDSMVIEEIKHPWSTKGQVAISGLDY